MSDSWLIAIPTDPDLVPEPECQQRAYDWFVANYPDTEIKIEVRESVQFQHCGQAFERIRCPMCRQELGLRWWQTRMDHDYSTENGFSFTPFQTPCCGAVCTLPDLTYEAPQGFARCFLIAMNPPHFSPYMPKNDEKSRELAAALGSSVRWIYCHL